MSLQGGLAIERMCFLTGASRAGFYRYSRAQDPWEEEVAVRSEVQKIALEHRGQYGYRRITAELQRQGLAVNHKRVSRIMREDSLVGSTKREQWFADSTDPRDQGIYVNLANRLNLTGPNQVWVADITFIRLRHEFVSLAAVLDKFSRKVVGWNLARTLTARLPLAALEMALETRRPGSGLVHHSDRGAQYAHAGYLRILRNHGALPSVSRPGRPHDKGYCERFFRTLKQEEIQTKQYSDLEDLRVHIAEFIDRYYNQERLHSALGYVSPAEFERITASSDAASIAEIKS